MNKSLTTLTFIFCLAGCGDPIGAPCEFSGSGFTASDNCRHRCLEHRSITCPDGTVIQRPKICSGARQCEPGGCANGQACYHVSDPFNKESYCLPNNLCGPLSAEEIAFWESSSKAAADELIAEWEAKKQKRQPTAPTPSAGADPVPD